jgi:hypothetical protein
MERHVIVLDLVQPCVAARDEAERQGHGAAIERG